ncbi:MAG TPA: glycosyltransferase [Bacteroidales bacterium]|nr:glycosyltransferase [Bacteroidales bacterium]
MFFSVVVPTYCRPDEVTELLASLEKQELKDFEIILADGSPDNSVALVSEPFKNRVSLKHLHKPKLGISESRNWGVENASGEMIVFFDSDCVIPPQYFGTVKQYLSADPLDAYGGPDRADESFSSQQKAISYAMTSFFTTGGIRGRKRHAGHYQPRSFNMGIRRSVFNALGGFSGLKVSEDIDLSMRLKKGGYRSGLIEDAYVYHKRRSTFYKFFRQVMSFGSGRIDLQLRHGDALKPVHTLPALFVIYVVAGLLAGLIFKPLLVLWASSLLVYILAVFMDSTIQNRSIKIGFLSIYATFVMLFGYGFGMIRAAFARFILGSKIESEKPEITKEA